MAMATRFNGFGEAVTMESQDAPWPSMYGPAPVAKPKQRARASKPKQA
jgi:hypothetical protein